MYEHDGEPFNLSTAPVLVQQEVKQQDFFIGTVRVNGRMDWPMLDSAVGQAFKVSLNRHLDCEKARLHSKVDILLMQMYPKNVICLNLNDKVGCRVLCRVMSTNRTRINTGPLFFSVRTWFWLEFNLYL